MQYSCQYSVARTPNCSLTWCVTHESHWGKPRFSKFANGPIFLHFCLNWPNLIHCSNPAKLTKLPKLARQTNYYHYMANSPIPLTTNTGQAGSTCIRLCWRIIYPVAGPYTSTHTHTNMYTSTQTQTHVPCVYKGINALPTHWFVRPCCITNASPVACFASSVGKTPLLLQQLLFPKIILLVNNWRQESCRVFCIDISKLLSSHPGFLNVFHLGNLKRPENQNLTLVKLSAVIFGLLQR